LGIKVHIGADSTHDLSGMKDADCMVYQRTGDTEADWAALLQQIRMNASAMTGLIVMESESHGDLLERIETATSRAATFASLTRKDNLQFTAVLTSAHDPAARSAAALLKTMSLRSNGAKVYVIRDKEHGLSSHQPAQAAALTLIDSIEKSDHSFTARGQFHPVSDTFLLDHTLGGSPILPMVVTVECFLESLSMAKETFRLTEGSLENLKIHQGFRFKIKKSFDYFIAGKEESAAGNAVSLALHGDFYNVQGERIKTDKLYSSAVVHFNGQHKGTNLNFTPISDEWHDIFYPDDLPIFHGASFRCLRQIHYISEHRAMATVLVPDPMNVFSGRKADTEPVLNAVVLDAALFSCGILHWKTKRQDVCIPAKIQRIVFGPGRLQKGESAQIHVEKAIADSAGRESGGDGKHAVFNFTIRDSRGDVVYDIEGYTATVLKAPTEISETAKEEEKVLLPVR
jgi:hypothetical protein